MINNTSYMMKKLEPLKSIIDPGDMVQQLSQLHTDKLCVETQFQTLSQAKTKAYLRLTALERELEALKKDNALLKSDKDLLQANHDRLATSISTKDKELEAANEQASLAVQGKALLETEVREVRQRLAEAEAICAADKVSLEAYEMAQRELQAEVDRLSRLKVDHVEVALIEEKSAKVDQLKRKFAQAEDTLYISRVELRDTNAKLEKGKDLARRLTAKRGASRPSK